MSTLTLQSGLVLKDIKHKKGIYTAEKQLQDITTLMLGQGMPQKEAHQLIKVRYK